MWIKKRCELCGNEYWTGNGKAKYCSDECKKLATKQRQKKWREEHPNYHKEYFRKHPEAVERFKERHPNYARDRSRKERGTQEYEKECVVCGNTFVTFNPNQRTCCNGCSRKLDNARKIIKRIPKEQVIDRDITLEAVYERDSGVCYLCGEKCDWYDRDNRITGPNYPTIDHVVPTSNGGMHEWSNVRLAHYKCNARKRNKPLEEYLKG